MRLAALVFLALVSASILASAATTLTLEDSAEPRGLRGAQHSARLYDLVAAVYTDNPACVRHVVEAALRGEAELFPPPYTIFRERYLSVAEGLGRGQCPVDEVHFYAYPGVRPGDAAYAAVCAKRQGRFWAMHDILFQNRTRLDHDDILSYAETIGLDTKAFADCLQDRSVVVEVSHDIDEGKRLKIRGTPTLFINGHMWKGALTPTLLEKTIDRLLDQ